MCLDVHLYTYLHLHMNTHAHSHTVVSVGLNSTERVVSEEKGRLTHMSTSK